MKKSAVLILLGIALLGGLAFTQLSTPKPDGVSVAPEHANTEPPGVTPHASQPTQAVKKRLKHKRVDSTDSASSSQAPALEPRIREALGTMLNTSSEGLVEETRNGTTSVDLKGRFQTAPVATLDKDGNIQITDYTNPPKTSKQP